MVSNKVPEYAYYTYIYAIVFLSQLEIYEFAGAVIFNIICVLYT